MVPRLLSCSYWLPEKDKKRHAIGFWYTEYTHAEKKFAFIIEARAVAVFRRSFVGLSPRRADFNPRPLTALFKIHKIEMTKVFLTVSQFCPVSITPPLVHAHLFSYRWRWIIFFSVLRYPLVGITPPLLHIHSFIYRRLCVNFFLSATQFTAVNNISLLLRNLFIYRRRCIILVTESVVT